MLIYKILTLKIQYDQIYKMFLKNNILLGCRLCKTTNECFYSWDGKKLFIWWNELGVGQVEWNVPYICPYENIVNFALIRICYLHWNKVYVCMYVCTYTICYACSPRVTLITRYYFIIFSLELGPFTLSRQMAVLLHFVTFARLN